MFRRPWDAAEVGLLASRYPTEGAATLARQLGRTEDSVTSQATRLRIPAVTRRARQSQTRRRRRQRAEQSGSPCAE